MKNKNNIQSIKQSGSLIFGLAMALLLFFQQPYVIDKAEQSDQTEQSQQEESEAEYQILAYDVLLPVMQFNLFHSFDLLIEKLISFEEGFSLQQYVEKAYHNYFHTLFQLIISPNAP